MPKYFNIQNSYRYHFFILILFCVQLLLFLLPINNQEIYAQGYLSCLDGGPDAAGKLRCADSTNRCDSGYVPPETCQDHANKSGNCALTLSCISIGTTPTSYPTATPIPAGGGCGGGGQKCCGAIPPLICNTGFAPNNPNVPTSCTCQAIPTSTPIPPRPTATPIPVTPPPGAPGKICNPGAGATGTGIETAIGCVPTEPTQFIQAVSRLATGAGGGIALLLIIAGAFKMITSAGNPDAVKEGSEQITSAIIGLLFIIFAVLLLQVIGVNILDLPGFG